MDRLESIMLKHGIIVLFQNSSMLFAIQVLLICSSYAHFIITSNLKRDKHPSHWRPSL